MSHEEIVLVVSVEGKNLGTMSKEDARDMAYQQGLDLVEVNIRATPNVYKIVDKGKLSYEKKKKQQKNKNNKERQIKEMKFNLQIDKHDQETKLNHIKRFLKKGLSVRLYVILRGREKKRVKDGIDKMNEIISSFNGEVRCDNMKTSDSQISMMIHSTVK